MEEMTLSQFMKNTQSTLNWHYAGDPLKLQSYIDALVLLEERAANAAQTKYLIPFALMKLEGKHRWLQQ